MYTLKRNFLLIVFLALFSQSWGQYSIEVGSYKYLNLEPPVGCVTHASWSCDEGLKLEECDIYGATVQVSHYFSGVADVSCSYSYTYVGSYDNRYHVGHSTKTYSIRCIGGTASISETNLELNVGETHTLKCSRSESYGTPTWTSSNEDIVTVNSNGKVKAVGSGVATITVDPVIAPPVFCNIRVNKIDPQSITLTPSTLTIQEGKTGTLSFKLSPTGASSVISWKSENGNIATVTSSGVVKGISGGTTRITATTDNGLSAYSTIEVVPLPSSVSLSTPSPISVGYSLKLDPTLSPSNSMSTFTWESSDNNIAVVDANGYLRGKSAGTATITVTTSNGKSASCRVTVSNPADGMDYRNANVKITVLKRLVDKTITNLNK